MRVIHHLLDNIKVGLSLSKPKVHNKMRKSHNNQSIRTLRVNLNSNPNKVKRNKQLQLNVLSSSQNIHRISIAKKSKVPSTLLIY